LTAQHIIRPIGLTKGPRDLSQYTYRMNSNVPCESVCYIWYLDGSQPKTIVDAGMLKGIDPELTSVEEAFSEMGMTPEDIDIVILTHLHADHISLGRLFKKAKFILQKKEMDYALHPHPLDAPLYIKKFWENLNFEIIEGEKQIIPGVSVISTPGHTPGGQSVEVDTSDGKAIITGFCCHLRTFQQTEFMKKQGWEVSIPLIHTDARECYDSVLKVKKRADIIIANHDVAYVGKKEIP